MSKKKPELTTQQLIDRLNLMHDAGGMLTKDRLNVIEQAAERLFQLDKRIAIMTQDCTPVDHEIHGKAHVMGANVIYTGGAEDEIC